MMKDLLLVVDMQNGFITQESKHIVKNIIELINKFNASECQVAFTKYINKANSPFVKWIGWAKFISDKNEIEIIDELHPLLNKNIFYKNTYGPFTSEFSDFLNHTQVKRIYICGMATESCILKTALDIFESELEPIVIEDACYSDAGESMHQIGLSVIKRNIGERQVVCTESVISRIKNEILFD